MFDLSYDDIIFPYILSPLRVEDLFNLRCVNKEFKELVRLFFAHSRRLDLSKIRKYSENVFKIVTDGCTKLRYLNLSNSKIATDQLIRELIKNNTQLTYINISNCHHLTSGILQTITIRNKCLQKLVLEDCHWVSRESIDYFSHYQGRTFAPNGQPHLIEANLSGCWELTDDVVDKFVTNFPKLKVFKVGKVYSLTDRTAFSIADNLREIEVLDISGCWRINDVGLQRVGEYCPKIRDLKVDECRKITEFSLKRFRDRGVFLDRKLDETALSLRLSCGLCEASPKGAFK